MTDIDNLRLLAAARAADDPLVAYALDGCADEIGRLRRNGDSPCSIKGAVNVNKGV